MMMADAEKMSSAAFVKKYGKENEETWKAMNESTIKEGKGMLQQSTCNENDQRR